MISDVSKLRWLLHLHDYPSDESEKSFGEQISIEICYGIYVRNLRITHINLISSITSWKEDSRIKITKTDNSWRHQSLIWMSSVRLSRKAKTFLEFFVKSQFMDFDFTGKISGFRWKVLVMPLSGRLASMKFMWECKKSPVDGGDFFAQHGQEGNEDESASKTAGNDGAWNGTILFLD